jgi:hypothetical protein
VDVIYQLIAFISLLVSFVSLLVSVVSKATTFTSELARVKLVGKSLASDGAKS